MEKLPLISVIVPVYKVEQYLDKCVSSIVNQTYKNLEIILVDDGSPDNCPAMCDEWAKRDSRIKAIHQENQGGGAARNVGLDVAKGNMIAFVDSDDYIEPHMYEHLHDLLIQGADIAECEFVKTFDDEAAFEYGDFAVTTYTAQEAIAAHIQDRCFRQLIWNKLYLRETIGEIRFPTGKRIDDEFFTYRVLGNARTLIRSNRICYAYRQQAKSVMHSLKAENRLDGVEAKVQRQAYVTSRFPDLAGDSLKNLWFTCIYQGQAALRSNSEESANKAIDYLKSVMAENPLTEVGSFARERFWLTMAEKHFVLTCRIRNALGIGL